MSAATVCLLMEGMIGNSFYWIAAGSGKFHMWATTTGSADPADNDFSDGGLCCFHLPLLCGWLKESLTKDQIGDLLVAQMMCGISGGAPNAWAPSGVTKYKEGTTRMLRGSVVFLSGKGAPYFAHVCVATGNGSDTVSFGHNAPYLSGGKHLLNIEKKSVGEILKLNPAFTDVHYGTPVW